MKNFNVKRSTVINPQIEIDEATKNNIILSVGVIAIIVIVATVMYAGPLKKKTETIDFVFPKEWD